MRTHIAPQTLTFLNELEENNNREWFNENKPRYEAAKEDFIEFMNALLQNLAPMEPALAQQKAKDTLFRIYRDVRFSHDKRPYKDHLCAYLTAEGRKSIKPGWYIHIRGRNKSFLAGGLWMPPAPQLKALRQEIDYNLAEFEAILHAPAFKKFFGKIEGDQLKSAPKGYAADHPAIDYLKRKSLNVAHALTDKQVASPGFLDHCTEVLQAMKPVNDFFLRAFHEQEVE
jgi:uncharacterized protein (TIGR02453 family)